MKLSDTLFRQCPWLITPEALQAMVATAHAFDEWDDDDQPEPAKKELYTVVDGVALVPMVGPMMRGDTWLSDWFDIVDMEAVGRAIGEAASRADVRAILLDIDSPGGTVNGTPELAQVIADATRQKYVYAFTAGQMCSAAYWIASQCDAIYMTPSARAGSIGVILPLVDSSEMYKKFGLKVEVFAAGKFKGAGMAGTTLSEEQRAQLQGDIDEIAADFSAAVLSRGRAIPAEAMEGQTFSARNAEKFKLASMVKDRTDVFARLGVIGQRPAVDSNARVMTIEQQLAAANARAKELDAKIKAQEEEDKKKEGESAEGEGDDKEKKDGEGEGDNTTEGEGDGEGDGTDEEQKKDPKALAGLVKAQGAMISKLTAQNKELSASVTALLNVANKLEARDKNLSRRANLEAARIVAETGTSTPASVTPGRKPGAGASSNTEALREQFAAIKDPKAQSIFMQGLTPAQLAAL